MISRKSLKKAAPAVIIAGVVAIGMLLLNPNILSEITANNPALSFVGVSCTGENIWIKYSLEDEDSRLANLIEDCDDNKAGGFVGTACFDVLTPKDNTYRMTCYSATKDSTQKISCGSGQGGKEFAGTTVPNDGIGTYRVKVSGTYYLKDENYATPHSYSWTEGTGITCVIPSSKCSDGTPINTCSDTYIGKYCSASATLVAKAKTCGCPDGQEEAANECMPIGWDVPAEEEPPFTPVIEEPDETTTPTEPEATPSIPAQSVSDTSGVQIGGVDVNLIIIGIAAFVLLFAGWIYFKR